ncbi:MAG: lipopolysaccharide kinase [Gemmatimonadetes bacterium]|nr:lipopolysaccharide kinase [Gemmatimonadota bacterium]
MLHAAADPVAEILEREELHAWAAHQEGRVELQGRGIAYMVALPGVPGRVVVRHNRHGGLLAPLTGDLFLPPTRGPLELAASVQLRKLGVPTPEVVAVATTRAAALFRRADVATRALSPSMDLGAALVSGDDGVRIAAIEAAKALMSQLSKVGARHPDLNVKNVLLVGDPHAPVAHVLDVDRVVFRTDHVAVARDNASRLQRSARKWRVEHQAHITDEELVELCDAAVAGAEGAT